MGATTERRWLGCWGIALLLATLMLPAATDASTGGGRGGVAIAAIPARSREPAVIHGGFNLTRTRLAMSARSDFVPRHRSFRHLVEPHVITVTAQGTRAESRGFAPAQRTDEQLATEQRFPSFSEQRRGILVVRGAELSFVVF